MTEFYIKLQKTIMEFDLDECGSLTKVHGLGQGHNTIK